MIKIRLRRVGAKKQPYYRVVVADARSPRDGRFIENIGHYDPRTDPPAFVIKEDRAVYWLQRGAQPTDPVLRMFKKLGTMQKLERVRAGELLMDILAEEVEHPIAAEEADKPLVPEELEQPPALEEEVAAVPLAEVSLEELGLSKRALKALSGAGMETAQDVLTKLEEGRQAILDIPGLGQKSLEEIEERLRDRGLLA